MPGILDGMLPESLACAEEHRNRGFGQTELDRDQTPPGRDPSFAKSTHPPVRPGDGTSQTAAALVARDTPQTADCQTGGS